MCQGNMEFNMSRKWRRVRAQAGIPSLALFLGRCFSERSPDGVGRANRGEAVATSRLSSAKPASLGPPSGFQSPKCDLTVLSPASVGLSQSSFSPVRLQDGHREEARRGGRGEMRGCRLDGVGGSPGGAQRGSAGLKPEYWSSCPTLEDSVQRLFSFLPSFLVAPKQLQPVEVRADCGRASTLAMGEDSLRGLKTSHV